MRSIKKQNKFIKRGRLKTSLTTFGVMSVWTEQGIDLAQSNTTGNDHWRLARVAGLSAVLGAVTMAASFVGLADLVAFGLRVGGAVFLAVAGLLAVRIVWRRRTDTDLVGAIAKILEHDGQRAWLADEDGTVRYRNPATDHADMPGDPPGQGESLAAAFADLFANPAAVLFRIQSKAVALGVAREDIVTRRGHVRLSVHRAGDGLFLWRLEDVSDKPSRPAEAVNLPMMTVGPSGTVLFMNDAFRRLVGGRVKSIDRVFPELPVVSGAVQRVSTPRGTSDALVAVLNGAGGRQEIYLLPAQTMAANRTADWDAIEDLPVPLVKVAPTGEVLVANRVARALLRSDMLPGSRLSDRLEGLGRPIVDWLHDVAQGRGAGGPEFLRVADDGVDCFVKVSLNLAGTPDDPHLIAVLNDVTEFKALELQFVQSQKMQAIGQLAGGVAHDFNNLLTAISGHCDLLLLRHDQGDQDYSDLVQINQNANRAASLVSQLLAFSRKQNLRPEVIDLRDTLSDLTHLLNRLVGERVKLLLNHDPDLDPIRADKRQLEQVIMNLVVNARDAMPSGGDIKIETENIDLAQAVERDRATITPGRYVLVRVVDEGHGIPPDKIGKIFEPFFTTKRTGEGTGLGLSTAYGIVKQTGGFIFVDSEEGIGTVFSLYFPVYDMPAQPGVQIAVAPPPPPPVNLPADGAVVLLVEDEAPVRAFASRALRLRGFTVIEADSAEAALALLEDPDLEVNIFVTDVIMPGMDGPTWVREALRERPHTKVVFVSGYAEDAFGEHQSAIPNSVFLPKPFSLNDLTNTVHQQLQ